MNPQIFIRLGRGIPAFLRALFFIASLLHLAAGAAMAAAASQKNISGDHAPDGLIVKYRQGRSPRESALATARRENLHHRAGARAVRPFPRLGMAHVNLKEGRSLEEALALYAADADVEYAQPDYLYHADRLPNDPNVPEQWGLPRIAAPAAWERATGADDVVIAVIDSGIDYTHPDLAPNMWVNTAEANGLPGVDDDTNGYVDDIHGINALASSGDPMDDNGHGSHVAGIAGAAGDNGIGVTGVAWRSRLMACKFLGSDGYGHDSDALASIEYIRQWLDKGVKIAAVNNSWSNSVYSQALADAIATIPETLFICAAGNEGGDTGSQPRYPGSYRLPNIVTVASTGQDDELSDFSNYGTQLVHIGAPGSQIFGVLPLALARGEEPYVSHSGTSMAAPHVSGLAALLKAQDGSRDWKALKNLLLSSGDELAGLAGKTLTGRRINADAATACEGLKTLAVTALPDAMPTGEKAFFSVLSIDCAAPSEPVTVRIDDGPPQTLVDDGSEGDAVARDGVFTGSFIPQDDAPKKFTFASPAGTIRLASPALRLTGATASPGGLLDLPSSSAFFRSGAALWLSFSSSGGVGPIAWSLASGALPPGLSLAGPSGRLSGTPSVAGSFTFTVKATDSLGYSSSTKWTLVISPELRDGWPLRLPDSSCLRTGANPPVVADLDGDGADEIVVADGCMLDVYGSSGLLSSTELASAPKTPAVADLDGDGEPEIVVVADSGPSDTRLLLYALEADLTPKAGFSTGRLSINPYLASTPAVADINGDGAEEIILTLRDVASGDVSLYAFDCYGNLMPGWPVAADTDASTTGETVPALADMNGDGLREAIFPKLDGSMLLFGPGGELSSFDYLRGYGAPDSVHPVIVGDLDGDGTKELLLNHSDAGGFSTFRVFEGNGIEKFVYPLSEFGFPTIATGDPSAFLVGDIDDDGVPELFYSFEDGSGIRRVNAVRPDGVSLPGWPVALPAGFAPAGPQNQPLLADADGDGASELLLNIAEYVDTPHGHYFSGHALAAFKRSGAMAAGFPKYIHRAGRLASQAAVGDLDGDGKPDLVAVSSDGIIYAWEAAAASDAGSPWPQYRQSAAHAGELPGQAGSGGLTLLEPERTTRLAGQTLRGSRPSGQTVTFTALAGSANGVVSYPTATTWQITLTDLAEGRNAISFECGGAARTATIHRDTAPPLVAIESPGEASVHELSPLLSFLADEGSAKAYIDEEPILTRDGEYLDPLDDGPHTLRVEATDLAGNVGEATVSFTVSAAEAAPGEAVVAASSSFPQDFPISNALGQLLWSEFTFSPGYGQRLVALRRGVAGRLPATASNPAMNDLGDLVWDETVDGKRQVFSLVGGSLAQVSHSQTGATNPTINNMGEILWSAPDANGSEQIYSNRRGQLTFGAVIHLSPALNDRGDAVWWQEDLTTQEIAGMVNGEAVHIPSPAGSDPWLNDSGEIVWADADQNGMMRIYSSTRGQLTFDAEDAFALHLRPTINDCGDVAYAQLGAGSTVKRLGAFLPCSDEAEPNSTYAAALTLLPGDAAVGVLDPGVDSEDWYRITLNGGDKLKVRVNSTARAEGSLAVRLTGPEGQPLATPLRSGSEEILLYTSPEGGEAYLKLVCATGGAIGYATSATVNEAVTEPLGPVIAQGQSVNATVKGGHWTPPPLTAADPNGDPLFWSLGTPPQHGAATVSGSGSSPQVLTYAPERGYYGVDAFTVEVSDGALSDTVTILVAVSSSSAKGGGGGSGGCFIQSLFQR